MLWMVASKNGQEEEAAKNNHGTCWVAQVAAFAKFTGNEKVLALCRARFRNHLLPDQLAPDGSFPLELARTKPYSYSLFDLDMLAIVCLIASSAGTRRTTICGSSRCPTATRTRRPSNSCFRSFRTRASGRIAHDVEYFDDLPNRQPSLLFAGLAYREPKYIALVAHAAARSQNGRDHSQLSRSPAGALGEAGVSVVARTCIRQCRAFKRDTEWCDRIPSIRRDNRGVEDARTQSGNHHERRDRAHGA